MPQQSTSTGTSSTMNRSSSLSRHSILEARARRRRRLQHQQQPPPPPRTLSPTPSSSNVVLVRHEDGDSLGRVLPVWISEDENNSDDENENDPNNSTQSMIHREIDSFILPLDADAKEKREKQEEDHERYDPYLVPISTIRQRLFKLHVNNSSNSNKVTNNTRLPDDDDRRPVPVPYVSIPRSHHHALSNTTHGGTDHSHPNYSSSETDSIIIMTQSLLLELIQTPSILPTERTDGGGPLDPCSGAAHHHPTMPRGDGLRRIERLQRWYHTENLELDENLLFEL